MEVAAPAMPSLTVGTNKSAVAPFHYPKKKPGSGGEPGFSNRMSKRGRGKERRGSRAVITNLYQPNWFRPLSRAFYLEQPMNDLELIARAHASIEPAQRPEPSPVSQPYPEEAIAAPITVCSRRETDESYEGVISRAGDLRIVNCPDDIQWIVQRLSGGQWRNKSFHRSRLSLIRRYGPLKSSRPCRSTMTGLSRRSPAARSVDASKASPQGRVTCSARRCASLSGQPWQKPHDQ
jgi:hypothetical protein